MTWSRLRGHLFGSRAARDKRRSDESGMALVSVVFLGMLFTIMGLAVFALSGYEYGQATQRDDSGSAFWFAEAAIEHAKAEVFNNIEWDAGFDSVALGVGDEGYYSLTIQDSVYDSLDTKWLYARGFVSRPGGAYVERDVEVFATVGPAAFEYALFSMNEINANGNPGVCGLVHGNDGVDDGGSAFDPPPGCDEDTELSGPFEVIPPAVRTEPAYYPQTTYYYIVGKAAPPYDQVLVCKPNLAGALFLRSGIRVDQVATVAIGGATGVSYGASTIAYNFSNGTKIGNMFNQTTGVCVKDVAAGDLHVVVNFGECLNSGTQWKSNLEFNDNNGYPNPILSTIINTRLIDTTDPDTSTAALVDSINWEGGNLTISQVSFQPTNGFAMLVHGFFDTGSAQVQMGTPASPALFYLTGSIGGLNANGSFYGVTIVLGNIESMNGNVDFYYNPDFIDNLPLYLQQAFSGSSGYLEVLFWREVPPLYL